MQQPLVGLPATPRSKPTSPPPSRPSSTPHLQHSPPSHDDSSRDSLSSFATSYNADRLDQLEETFNRSGISDSSPSTAGALSITTSFPSPRDSPPPTDAPELLPTYGDLQSAEPANPRFGRWRGWIEKRSNERREERDAARSEGRTGRSGWDLPGESAQDDEYWESGDELGGAGRDRDAAAERRLSRQQPLVTNPDGGDSSPAPSTSSSMLHAGHGVVPLTVGTSIYPLGSRFLQQVPEQPRCGVVLPVGGKSVEGFNLERFVLVGTSEGLYLTDLLPSLGTVPLRTSNTTSDAIVLPLWTGLGVFQLEVFVEESRASDAGVVFAIVRAPGETEGTLRMWSLQTIVNLAKWRCFNSTSEPVSLAPSGPSLAPRSSSSASPTSHRSSRAFIKSLFTEGLKDIKGKGKSTVPPAATSRPAEEGYVVVDSSKFPRDGAQEELASSPYRLRAGSAGSLDSTVPPRTAQSANSQSHLLHSRHRSLAAPSSDTPSSSSSAPTPSPPNEATSLPLEWARSSISLPLPRGHGPILFFQLSKLPQPELDFAEDDEDEDGVRKPKHLFLAVATARTVYLFESRPSERRTWTICNEFYAPSTPRFISLVRLDPSIPDSNARNHRTSTASHPSATSNLALFLGTKEKAVIIRLADSSVAEVELPTPPAFPSTGSLRLRDRGNSKGSSTSARAAARVAAFVEGKQGIPAGVRGEEGGIAVGRRVPEGGETESPELAVRNQWVGCEELVLPMRIAATGYGHRTRVDRHLYLLSKGRTTHVVLSPLGAHSRSSSSTDTSSHPSRPTIPTIRPQPIFAFHWPSPVRRVVALLPPNALSAEEDAKSFYLVLIAFTTTGLSIQEGTISKSHLEGLYGPSNDTSTPFFTPTRSQQTTPLHLERRDLDPDLEDKASFDWGRETAFLCAGGPWWEGKMVEREEEGARRARGVFFWSRQPQSDFGLKWVGNP